MHPNKNYLITLLPNNRRGYAVSFAFSTEALCIIAKKTRAHSDTALVTPIIPSSAQDCCNVTMRVAFFCIQLRQPRNPHYRLGSSLHRGDSVPRLTSSLHGFFFSPQELKVLEGQSVTLRCKARGDPDPIIHWIAPDGRLMSNSSRAAVHTDGTLDILISTVKDSGPLTPRQLHSPPPASLAESVVSSCTLRMSGRLSTMHNTFLSIESPMRRQFHTSFILF